MSEIETDDLDSTVSPDDLLEVDKLPINVRLVRPWGFQEPLRFTLWESGDEKVRKNLEKQNTRARWGEAVDNKGEPHKLLITENEKTGLQITIVTDKNGEVEYVNVIDPSEQEVVGAEE